MTTPIIETDPDLNLEKNSQLKKLFNFFLIPLLNLLPKSFNKIVSKSHPAAEKVIRHKTTHNALELLYRGGSPKESQHFLHRLFHKIWFNTNNAKAVRNRLRIIKKLLRENIERIAAKKNQVKIISIASGSARAVLETLSLLNLSLDKKITAIFVDKNPDAASYSKKLSKKLNIPRQFKLFWVVDTASAAFKRISGEKADIVEMVGLLDYFDDQKAEKIFSLIYDNLKEGGVLITANIHHNKEERFLTRVIGWHMVYRKAEDLSRLASHAGFDTDKITLLYEPLKIHSIMIAKK